MKLVWIVYMDITDFKNCAIYGVLWFELLLLLIAYLQEHLWSGLHVHIFFLIY